MVWRPRRDAGAAAALLVGSGAQGRLVKAAVRGASHGDAPGLAYSNIDRFPRHIKPPITRRNRSAYVVERERGVSVGFMGRTKHSFLSPAGQKEKHSFCVCCTMGSHASQGGTNGEREKGCSLEK